MAGTGVIDDTSVPLSQIECTIFITAWYTTLARRLVHDAVIREFRDH